MIRTALLLAALLFGLSAPPAEALSCRRPDVARSFQAADTSPERYVVVLGQLDFDATPPPKTRPGQPPQPRRLRARLQGRGVTPTGFGAWVDRDITVEITCVSAWCGSVPKFEQMLMFLRQSGNGLTLEAGPCPQFHFPSPTAADLATLRRCLSGAPCTPRSR